MMSLRGLLGVGAVTGLLVTLGILNRAGWIIGNTSPSVPPGFYITSDPDRATYITFCLGHRHRDIPTYADLCTPDTPDAPRILKRIATRHEDGSLTVAGDTARALDSRFLGRVRPADTRGWWVPLLIERKGQIK